METEMTTTMATKMMTTCTTESFWQRKLFELQFAVKLPTFKASGPRLRLFVINERYRYYRVVTKNLVNVPLRYADMVT